MTSVTSYSGMGGYTAASDNSPTGDGPRWGTPPWITVLKSRRHNQLEGMALSALFKFFPLFLMLAILLKHRSGIPFFGLPGVALFLAVAASVSYPWLQQVLESKFPRVFRGSCEPSFYDASLSVPQKLQGWFTNRRALREIFGNVVAIVLVVVLVVKTGGL